MIKYVIRGRVAFQAMGIELANQTDIAFEGKVPSKFKRISLLQISYILLAEIRSI